MQHIPVQNIDRFFVDGGAREQELRLQVQSEMRCRPHDGVLGGEAVGVDAQTEFLGEREEEAVGYGFGEAVRGRGCGREDLLRVAVGGGIGCGAFHVGGLGHDHVALCG